jgi:hypothetical protein
MSLEEMEALWQQVKRDQRAQTVSQRDEGAQ